jgi:hypothetical protein
MNVKTGVFTTALLLISIAVEAHVTVWPARVARRNRRAIYGAGTDGRQGGDHIYRSRSAVAMSL